MKIRLAPLLVLFIFVSIGFAQTPVQPPKVDSLESEKLFSYAYNLLLERKYWKAEEAVGLSLSADPYHIDGYLLRALISRGKGLFSQSVADLKSYLEVRPRDHTAAKILSGINETSSDLIKLASVSYLGIKQPLKKYFNLPPNVFSGTLGLIHGDVIGDKLALADSLADQVQVFERGNRRDILFEDPSDVIFLDEKRIVLLSEGGKLEEFEDTGDSFISLRSSDLGVSADSIAFLSSSLLAVSLPFEREVRFLSYPGLKTLNRWSPVGNTLFEPRGLTSRGKNLAIADRRGDRVFLTTWDNLGENYFLEVSSPRSLVWGPTGDLLVLSDEGFISVFARGRNKGMVPVDKFLISEAICLARSHDRIFSVSSDGRYVTIFEAYPGDKDSLITGVGLFHPVTEPTNEDRGQTVEVSLNLSSPFRGYLSSQRGVLSSVWQDSMKGGRIVEIEGRGIDGAILSPINSYKYDGDLWASVGAGESIENAVRKIWEKTDFLSQIVLDSHIDLNENDCQWLYSFCVMNGVSLSVWASKIPSDFLISVVENTGGNVYYSDSLSDRNLNDIKTKSFIVKIFYPDTVSSSGYPSKNMLSIIADFGMISYRGWLPIWPDMLRQ